MRSLLWPLLAQLVRHIPNFFRLFWRLFRDRRVGLLPKTLLLVIPAYLFLPWDLVPDFLSRVIVGLGWVDDAIVAYLVLRGFIALCPPPVVREHVARIEAETRRSIR